MFSKIDSFKRIYRDEGIISAGLATGQTLLPSPLWQHCAFTRSFLTQKKAHPEQPHYHLWRSGFSPKSAAIYEISKYGEADFLTDRQEQFCWGINSAEGLLNDKQQFYDLLEEKGYNEYIPTRYGKLIQGTVGGIGVHSLLNETPKLVIKRREGGGGSGIHFCSIGAEDDYEFDGKPISKAELKEQVKKLDGYLVTEFVNQHSYCRTIFPKTPNTIRILTICPDKNGVFVARAVHRFGSSTSGAVDNFSQGGLSAQIGESGELSSAVRYHNGEVTWHETHPDTGADIAGETVPEWESICKLVKTIAADLDGFDYVGWDVLITSDLKVKIIEANANTDTDLLQAHGPLLRNQSTKEFFDSRGILSR